MIISSFKEVTSIKQIYNDYFYIMQMEICNRNFLKTFEWKLKKKIFFNALGLKFLKIYKPIS